MLNGKVHIVTDSTCDIDISVCETHGIHMVPLNVHFGPEDFKDRENLPLEEFYRRLSSGGPHPTTSQPSPNDFQNLYRKLLADGGEIISMHISSKMSGTFQSAMLAREETDRDRIHVIDSRTVSIGLGMMVIESARAAESGKSAMEILDIISQLSESSRFYFLVDTLDFLQKGGRIGRAAALIGSLLNIKPILEINDGMVSTLEKVRGTKKAQRRMADLVSAHLKTMQDREAIISLAWSGDSSNLMEMEPLLGEYFDPAKAQRTEIGAVVGTHVGPGAVGISICGRPRKH